MARVENLFNSTLGGRNGGLTNAGGFSLQYAFLDDTEVEVVLRAVSKQERSEQIEAPRLLVYNNTRASMHYLRNISYIRDFEVEIAQAAAVANPVIGTVHDGVALDVRPVVSADRRFINLELRPTIANLVRPIEQRSTTLGSSNSVTIELPEVEIQRVRTSIPMPDGATVMLGGNKISQKQDQASGVPLLNKIPFINALFERKGTFVSNRKLLILLKAGIVIPRELEPTPAELEPATLAAAARAAFESASVVGRLGLIGAAFSALRALLGREHAGPLLVGFVLTILAMTRPTDHPPYDELDFVEAAARPRLREALGTRTPLRTQDFGVAAVIAHGRRQV